MRELRSTCRKPYLLPPVMSTSCGGIPQYTDAIISCGGGFFGGGGFHTDAPLDDGGMPLGGGGGMGMLAGVASFWARKLAVRLSSAARW